MTLKKLCFAAPVIGRTSEVWMYRQLTGFTRLSPYVMTWGREHSEVFALNGIPLDVLPFDRGRLMHSHYRWFHRLRTLHTGNFYGAAGSERRAIVAYLRETRPDVILCQYGHTALKVLPAAAELRIPLVAHFHGIDVSSSLQCDRWYRWSLRHSLPRFRAVIVVGRHQRTSLLELGMPPERLFVIPCGVPVAEFARASQDGRSSIVYVVVARLVEKKGVEYILEAFARASQQLPGASLLIVGDGPLRGRLEQIAKQGPCASRIRFAGECPPAQVRDFLAHADVFVQHSVVPPNGAMEGSPVAIAEAAAAGLPVVASRHCGGTEELVADGETGYLVAQRDVETLSERIVRLGRDKALREAMGAAGRERVERLFDAARQIERLEDVLLSCANQSEGSKSAH